MAVKKLKIKTLSDVMREHNCVFSMSLSDGFANLSFDEKGDVNVEFLGDEGEPYLDSKVRMKDVQKVAKLMEDLKSLRLDEYKSN